jgi:hypothetical protein
LFRRGGPCAYRSRGFRLGFVSYVAHETKALASKGLDQALLGAVVTDRAPGRIDPRSERRFRDNSAAPDRGDQIAFGGNALTVFDQIRQKVEHLRLNRHRNGAPTELAPIRVESIVFK